MVFLGVPGWPREESCVAIRFEPAGMIPFHSE